MKVAFVHEWFSDIGGSEKVLEAMHAEFPQAAVYALFDALPDEKRPDYLKGRLKTSFMQRIPGIGRLYKFLLPLMPIAIEQLDLSEYDVVVSNSHAVAKGVITGPDTLHLCMCHTPMRYAWDLQGAYLKAVNMTGPLAWFVRYQLHKIRIWDCRTSNGVDHFIANSRFIARRIWKTYRREATVIYPNVDTEAFTIGDAPREDFYVTASRVVPYKRMRLIVEAFNAMPERKLVVIGHGSGLSELRKIAGPNVEILGRQPFEALRKAMQTARAFVYAAEEDFGIVVVEAQACGTPVIAYAKGGAVETVVDGSTGIHFPRQTVEAIRDAVERFENEGIEFKADGIRAHATRFSTARFRREFSAFLQARWREHEAEVRGPFRRSASDRRIKSRRGGQADTALLGDDLVTFRRASNRPLGL